MASDLRQTDRMMSEAQAMQALTREDPAAATDARAAISWLSGDAGLGAISLMRLQEFLWYVLPSSWPMKTTGHLAVARALGRLLMLAGLDRYAEVCDSAQTKRIIAAYATAQEDGIAAYTEAIDASSTVPPDTDLLAWGSVMGSQERAAYDACAAALELAVASRELRVGVSGWKTKRSALVDRWLTSPALAGPETRRTGDEAARRGEPLGAVDEGHADTWLSRISAERIDDWMNQRPGERGQLARQLVPRLLEPPVLGDDPLPTLHWLLAQAADGLRLTARHYISPALVSEAAELFGWGAGRRRQELEVFPLHTLRLLATREMGAIRRHGSQLVLTPAGRLMITDPAVCWHIATASVLGADDGPQPDFAVAVREAALLITLVDGPCGYPDLTARLASMHVAEGWASARDTMLEDAIRGEIHHLRHRLRALNLLCESDLLTAPLLLTKTGTAAALSALLARALRPRHHPPVSQA